MVTIKILWELRRNMATFTYTDDIPDATHNPSTDQPDMKINTNSIDSIIAVDHYSFEEGNLNRDGWHKQSTYPTLGVAPTTLALQGAVYTKDVGGGVTQLFYRPQSNSTEIQLTGVTPQVANNGYSSLPGGILIQWGQKALVGTGEQAVTINYVAEGNIAMPNDTFVALATLRNSTVNTTNNPTIACRDRTAAGFTAHYSGASGYNEFQWIAIGW